VTILALLLLALGGAQLPPVAFIGALTAGLLFLIVFEMWSYQQAQSAVR
jgi:hypothetical protein